MPAAALVANGGPLDGVVAGWTWDQVLVGQWRTITVCNQASGRRTIYIDGYSAIDANPSTSSVSANTSFTLLSGCPVTFAEFVIWNTSALTPQEIANHKQCMRIKWSVSDLPARVSSQTTFSGTFSLPKPVYSGGSLPSSLAKPSCWLDATYMKSLCTDTEGLMPATGGYQRIRLWKDRSGNNKHVIFSSAAVIADGAIHAINGKPVMIVADTGCGVFSQSPIASISSTTGYTIAAVWRLTSGGGHPLSVDTTAKITSSGWTEVIDAGKGRTQIIFLQRWFWYQAHHGCARCFGR